MPAFVYATGTSLHVANCGFRADSTVTYHDHIRAHATVCQIRNCVFIAPFNGASVDAEACQNLHLDNCLHVGGMALAQPPGESVKTALIGP